jgi:flagellar motility protein MotE (MotC chaperone)
MKKLMPKFLVLIFAVATILQLGQFGFDYYGNWSFIKAQAAQSDNEEKIKTAKTLSNSNKKLRTVQDKILDTGNQNPEEESFFSKVGTTIIDKEPHKICITDIMLQDVKKQLEYLEEREKSIKEQEKLLEISDRRIREQIAKLKLIKDDIVESAKLADSKIQKESKRLISIYEKMKPKEAANIFNEMDPNIAAELLRTMKEDQSSEILAKMNPKVAYNVTLSLAGGIKNTKEKYNKIK